MDKTLSMLPLQATVDQGVIAVKEYSALPKAPALMEPHHQSVLYHIRTLVRGVLLIMQPQVTGPV